MVGSSSHNIFSAGFPGLHSANNSETRTVFDICVNSIKMERIEVESEMMIT